MVKGLRSRDWYLQDSYRDVKYSTGNVVNSMAITSMMPVGYWKYQGEH